MDWLFKSISGSESERIKKNFQSLFKTYQLEIIIECNKKVLDYLYFTINLNARTYKPYHTPGNKTTYIKCTIKASTKYLPKTIKQQLFNNSSNEAIFNEAVPLYEKALSEAGYDFKLKYNSNKKTKQNKKKKRNIIWFNQP